jgi:DNA repair protein RadD
VIVIDEAHSMYSAWTNYIDDCSANVIGLSATPFSKGLGRLFTNLINAATMNELTQSGVLVPMRVFSCTKIDMRGAETSGGEWKDSAAAERGMDIIGDVVTEWQKYAENRKTIVFGATINHCEELCRQFNESGIMAATFTSDTTPEERRVLLDEYKKPNSLLKVLISVEALAKGFDVKDVGSVCDCRPLRKSLSTAIQMWGRGLRSSPDTGKVDCILLDFSGNIIRFADDFSDIYYNGLDQLDAGEKLDKTIRRDDEDEKEPSKCPACGFSPCGKRCISCGHENQPKNLIEHLPGEMTEVMIGKSKFADDRKHLYEQVCTYTRSHGNPETAKQRAWYLFQDLTGGIKPANQWKFDDQPNTPITRATLNHITRTRIAFSKRKTA